MSVDDDIPKLIKAIEREKIAQAMRMTPEERLLAGPRLFDQACRVALDGIRAQFPDATEEEVHQILWDRVELQRRLERIEP